jgi:hypothetical protein
MKHFLVAPKARIAGFRHVLSNLILTSVSTLGVEQTAPLAHKTVAYRFSISLDRAAQCA